MEHLEALREAAPRPVERFIEFEPPPWNEPTVAETKFLEMYGGEMDKKAINRIDTTRRVSLDATASAVLPADPPLQRLGLLAASIHVLQLAQDRDAPPAFLLQLAALADFPIVPSSTISPQAEAILSLLEGYKDRAEPSSTAFHAIVFCQQRSHARILAELVRRADGLKGWLKPGVLVGHGGNDGDDGMAIKRQQEVLAAFRRGELNLLFATQVAEEGIDMRECNVVVRADGLQTMTA